MEVSGMSFRRVPFLSGSGIDTQSSKFSFTGGLSVDGGNRFSAFAELRLLGSRDSRVTAVRPRKASGFRDESHLKYYYESPRCGAKKDKVTTKKKLKLLKALSKDLSVFSDLGFGVDTDQGLVGEVKGKMIAEATEVLLKQLQQMRAEEKEMKRKRKEEKAKMRAAKMKTKNVVCESSSSSESSDSECGEVVLMTHLRRNGAIMEPIKDEPEPVIQETKTLELPSSLQPVNTATRVGLEQNEKRIEICMGGKCKKSGAGALLEEFERVVGVEGAVVGCKCMGKCREGPNVRVLNSMSGVELEAEELDDSVRTPTNPLCIGVGLQDVGIIVSNLFGETHENIGLPAPA